MQAHLRKVRISPKKMQMVSKVIRGMDADKAMAVLSNLPNKSAFLLGKVLKSAVSGAKENNKVDIKDLTIHRVEIGDGPRFRRFKAGSRGRAMKLIKRTSNLSIYLAKK